MSLLLPQTKIFITEDSNMLDGIGPGVIIVNHQFDRDWWHILTLAQCVGQHGRVKIILPQEMRHIPVLGWALQLLEFPFLGRSWGADDHKSLQEHLHTFQGDEGIFFLLFPEGAKLDTRTYNMSISFSKQEGRPELEHLLLPHLRCFHLILEALKSMEPAVFDVTMVTGRYAGEKVVSHPSRFLGFMALLLDIRPKSQREEEDDQIFIHIKRFSSADIRSDAQWLDRQWENKDFQLEYFSRHGAFPSIYSAVPSVAAGGLHGCSLIPTAAAPVRALRNTRRGLESSLVALAWLCILPFFCPFLVLINLPISIAIRMLLALKDFVMMLTPGYQYESQVNISSPHVPQTPFCTPSEVNVLSMHHRRSRAENGQNGAPSIVDPKKKN